jgi:DNA-binding response OmpR family regulator
LRELQFLKCIDFLPEISLTISLNYFYSVVPFDYFGLPLPGVAVRVLVSANDPGLAAFLARTFRSEHYDVDVSSGWSESHNLIDNREYDLALFEFTFFAPTAVAALQHARGARPDLPILILIERSETRDTERLLAMGVDDFIVRSGASSPEVFARARAVLHRGKQHFRPILRVHDLEIDPARRSASRAGKAIHLTSKEYSLLEYLMRNAGRSVTREQILDRAWNLPVATHTNVVEVYINYLRKKIDNGSEQKLIQTIRGTGYRLGRSTGENSPARAASA